MKTIFFLFAFTIFSLTISAQSENVIDIFQIDFNINKVEIKAGQKFYLLRYEVPGNDTTAAIENKYIHLFSTNKFQYGATLQPNPNTSQTLPENWLWTEQTALVDFEFKLVSPNIGVRDGIDNFYMKILHY